MAFLRKNLHTTNPSIVKYTVCWLDFALSFKALFDTKNKTIFYVIQHKGTFLLCLRNLRGYQNLATAQKLLSSDWNEGK